MKELISQIAPLVADELERANKLHGDYFRSDHEGESVIREEMQEVDDETTEIEMHYSMMWEAVKDDNPMRAAQSAYKMQQAAIRAAAESIQVAAMCRKFIFSQQIRDSKVK